MKILIVYEKSKKLALAIISDQDYLKTKNFFMFLFLKLKKKFLKKKLLNDYDLYILIKKYPKLNTNKNNIV